MAHKSPGIWLRNKINCVPFPRLESRLCWHFALPPARQMYAQKSGIFWTELHRPALGLCCAIPTNSHEGFLAANQRSSSHASDQSGAWCWPESSGPRSRPGARDGKSLTNSFHRGDQHEVNFYQFTQRRGYILWHHGGKHRVQDQIIKCWTLLESCYTTQH